MATTDILRLPRWDWSLINIAVVAAIAAAGVATFALPVAPPTPIASPVVKVEIGKGHGSGVYIGNGLYLTAAHVTAQDGAMTLKTNTAHRSALSVFGQARNMTSR